jgi:hypothetical protein
MLDALTQGVHQIDHVARLLDAQDARGDFKFAIIKVLGSGSAQSSAFLIDALKEGMNENGLTEGRDYVLDVR